MIAFPEALGPLRIVSTKSLDRFERSGVQDVSRGVYGLLAAGVELERLRWRDPLDQALRTRGIKLDVITDLVQGAEGVRLLEVVHKVNPHSYATV